MKTKNWMYGLLSVAAAFAFVTAAGHFTIGDEAVANQCAQQCQAQENACRKAKAGDPSCEAEMAKCLQGCRK